VKILIVTERTCARSLKQIVALSQRNDIHLITKRVTDVTGPKTTTYYNGTHESLHRALELYKDVDIVYVHSEPSWTVFEVRRSLPSKKIVLDIHDAQIWRTTNPAYQSAEERLAFRWVDGLVVPSYACKRILKSPLPSVVLPPYVNEAFYVTESWQRKGGIVYEGRIDLSSSPEFMNYSKFTKLCKAFDDVGIPFHIYVPISNRNDEIRKEYADKCILHKPLSFDSMVTALGFHDWGLCGNLDNFREWNVAMPNKLFEYMAGGIPIIALNAKEVGTFVEKHGIGISVKTIDEIKERWDERERCQRNVFLKRYEWTMEKHIHIVEDLMKGLLHETVKKDNIYAECRQLLS